MFFISISDKCGVNPIKARTKVEVIVCCVFVCCELCWAKENKNWRKNAPHLHSVNELGSGSINFFVCLTWCCERGQFSILCTLFSCVTHSGCIVSKRALWERLLFVLLFGFFLRQCFFSLPFSLPLTARHFSCLCWLVTFYCFYC